MLLKACLFLQRPQALGLQTPSAMCHLSSRGTCHRIARAVKRPWRKNWALVSWEQRGCLTNVEVLGGVDRLEPVIQNHYRQSGMQGSSYPFQKSVHVDICSNLDGGCEKWISVDLAVSSLPISGMCPSRCSSPWKQILTWRPGQKLLGYVGIQWILGDIGGGSKAYEAYWNITYITT